MTLLLIVFGAGLFLGALAGITILGCCAAAGKADDRIHRGE